MIAQAITPEDIAPLHAAPAGIWGCTFTCRGIVSAPPPAVPMPRNARSAPPVPSNACWRLPRTRDDAARD
jgi:hypothetical protein